MGKKSQMHQNREKIGNKVQSDPKNAAKLWKVTRNSVKKPEKGEKRWKNLGRN